MTVTTKAAALNAASRAQAALNSAEKTSAERGARRDLAILNAQGAGATYAEIQGATGLSTPRVTQVLRRAKNTHATTN